MAKYYTQKGVFKDYYRILGISSSATTKEIRDSYSSRIKEFQRLSERRFSMIEDVIEAYTVLNDNSDRARYDIEYRINKMANPTSESETHRETTEVQESLELQRARGIIDGLKMAQKKDEPAYRQATAAKKQIQKGALIDIENLYICLYDWGKVGYFKGERFLCNEKSYGIFGLEYDSGLQFTGYNAPYLAIVYDHHQGGNFSTEDIFCNERFAPTGKRVQMEDKIIVPNCRIQYFMTVDEMRQIMFKAGDTLDLNTGPATEEELKEILKYAYKYYTPTFDEEMEKEKKRESFWS